MNNYFERFYTSSHKLMCSGMLIGLTITVKRENFWAAKHGSISKSRDEFTSHNALKKLERLNSAGA
jgi:hypothetical protein